MIEYLLTNDILAMALQAREDLGNFELMQSW